MIELQIIRYISIADLLQHLPTILADPLPTHVQEILVHNHLVEPSVLLDDTGQLQIVLAAHVRSLTAHVLTVVHTAYPSVMQRASESAVHRDRLAELPSGRIQNLRHQRLQVLLRCAWQPRCPLLQAALRAPVFLTLAVAPDQLFFLEILHSLQLLTFIF